MADLRGHAVFLSASFPSADERGQRFAPFDAAGIADAVTVAGELDREGAVDVYQSAHFEPQIPPATWQLVERYGKLHMVPADESGEREPSLERMRRQMLGREDLLAGVFVGGMDGIADEYRMLRDLSDVPVVPIAAPGGAARELEPSPQVAARLGPTLRSERYPALAMDLVALLAEQLGV